MEKVKQIAQLVLVVVGEISALFYGMFVFSSIIYVLGPSDYSGDLIKWGVYLISKLPIVAIILFALAAYSVYKFDKHF